MDNIVFNFEAIYNIMKSCIEREIPTGGLLEDVSTFIPVYYNENKVDEPVIWMTQHPSRAERQADISQKMELVTPFQFTCCVYDNDEELADLASSNLATRAVLAVTRNLLSVQRDLYGKRIITNVGLETFYPVGEVSIVGSSRKAPATGVVLNVKHTLNWQLICKKLNENDNNE